MPAVAAAWVTIRTVVPSSLLTSVRTFSTARPVLLSSAPVGSSQKSNQIRNTREHKIGRDKGVGQDKSLDRAVADVAFVPERDVFERRRHV